MNLQVVVHVIIVNCFASTRNTELCCFSNRLRAVHTFECIMLSCDRLRKVSLSGSCTAICTNIQYMFANGMLSNKPRRAEQRRPSPSPIVEFYLRARGYISAEYERDITASVLFDFDCNTCILCTYTCDVCSPFMAILIEHLRRVADVEARRSQRTHSISALGTLKIMPSFVL